jgi:hypothetical protein
VAVGQTKANGYILVWESLTGIISVRLLRSHASPGAPLNDEDWFYLPIYSFLEAPTNFFNCFWIKVAVSLLKPPHGSSELKRPLRSRFGLTVSSNKRISDS